jgi:phosphoribosylformylglycinamidine synthase
LNDKSTLDTSLLPEQIITLPIAHGEGQFYCDQQTLSQLETNGQVLFRYESDNPNGSINNIAGICNRQGNILGMMPHPERASDARLGSTDGLKLFQGLLKRVEALAQL